MLYFFWEHKIGKELGPYFCEYSFEDGKENCNVLLCSCQVNALFVGLLLLNVQIIILGGNIYF